MQNLIKQVVEFSKKLNHKENSGKNFETFVKEFYHENKLTDFTFINSIISGVSCWTGSNFFCVSGLLISGSAFSNFNVGFVLELSSGLKSLLTSVPWVENIFNNLVRTSLSDVKTKINLSSSSLISKVLSGFFICSESVINLILSISSIVKFQCINNSCNNLRLIGPVNLSLIW